MTAPHHNVLITGAGSGLGRAMALRFARDGRHVAVTDVDGNRAEAVLAEIRDAGGEGIAQRLDVSRQEDWDAACQRVLTEWGGLGVLVNNAGVAAAGNLEQTPLSDWEWVLGIDLMGVVRGCHRFLPMMREQGHGHIVNVASFAGLAGAPGISAYGTAKAGVVALSEQLRAELHGSGVGVSLLCPAFVATGLMESFRSPDPADRERVERWMATSGVNAEMVADAVADAVDRGRFLVLTHANTRWAWRLKRWLPERYFRLLVTQGSVSRPEVADAN